MKRVRARARWEGIPRGQGSASSATRVRHRPAGRCQYVTVFRASSYPKIELVLPENPIDFESDRRNLSTAFGELSFALIKNGKGTPCEDGLGFFADSSLLQVVVADAFGTVRPESAGGNAFCAKIVTDSFTNKPRGNAREMIKLAHRAITKFHVEPLELGQETGTTVTLARISADRTIRISHAGDTGIILVSPDGTIKKRTPEHTKIQPYEAAIRETPMMGLHPWRHHHVNALGGKKSLENPSTIPSPEVEKMAWKGKKGDFVIGYSDGWSDNIRPMVFAEASLGKMIEGAGSAEEVRDRLLKACHRHQERAADFKAGVRRVYDAAPDKAAFKLAFQNVLPGKKWLEANREFLTMAAALDLDFMPKVDDITLWVLQLA